MRRSTLASAERRRRGMRGRCFSHTARSSASRKGRSRRGTAYGWYYLAVGIGALPASVLFGLVWDRVSPRAAFDVGATLAFAAAVVLLAVRPPRATDA